MLLKYAFRFSLKNQLMSSNLPNMISQCIVPEVGNLCAWRLRGVLYYMTTPNLDTLIFNLGRKCRRRLKGWGMPKGPRGQKRPADAVGCAIMVAKIATGEIEEELQEPSGKIRSGKAGGEARAVKLTKKDRAAIAKKAAVTRWGTHH